MAPVIPGVNKPVQPRVFTRVKTRERVNAVSGGARIVCIIGEGETEETLIESAIGSGQDGWNSDYSGTNLPDGRHFRISKLSLIPNRTRILKNGLPLRVLEAQIDRKAFDTRYDVRVDPDTGRVETQRARLEDQGTDALGNTIYYASNTSNVGTGTPIISVESLVDADAPEETWTARVVTVIKDGSGNPISGQSTITVTGSTSGQIKTSAGVPIVWKSDGVFVSNGILNIAFSENTVPFAVGDRFTIKVGSGVLSANDNLVARYIANEDLEDPEIFFTPDNAFAKHGNPSVDNNLSLGIQMAFENQAPLVMAIQAKPTVPRKTSETLIAADNLLTDGVEGATGNGNISDTIFPLPLGTMPDIDSNVNVFVVNSDGTEEQLLLNKRDFYDPSLTTTALAYSNFVLGPTSSEYTVFESPQVEESGTDGYVRTTSTTEIYFSSPTASFSADRLATGEGDVGKQLILLTPSEVAATYTIDTIGDGYGATNVLTATRTSGTHVAGNVFDGYAKWQLVDPNDMSAYFAITDDVAVNSLTAGKGLRIDFVDQRDADFFDTNWANALIAAEKADLQILCPLPKATISNVFQACKAHVEAMSNILNQKERILIVGAIDGLTPDNVLGKTLAAVEDIGVLEGIQGDDPEEVLASNIEDLADYSIAAAYSDSFRVAYMYPDRIVRNIAGTNTFLSGFYMSPAFGGFLGSQTNVGLPPTFKTLNGFNILRDRTFRQNTLDDLGGAGALVVVPIAGGGKMLWARTTVGSGAPEEEEISVVGVRDQVARTIRASLATYIGRIQTATLIPEVNAGIAKLLRALVGQGLLAGFGNITVRRNEIEPRQIDISCEINPVVGVNWIFVDMTVAI